MSVMEAEMEDVDSAVIQANLILNDLPLEKLYEFFSQSNRRDDIVRSFQVLKSRLSLTNLHGLDLYKALKEKLGTQKTWKARDVFQLLEKRANQKEYLQQTAAKGVRVFIVGAGPIGLRQAIDCILLGAEVTVIEKRSSFSRNNVLHLWPCTIEDLRQLGAKKFYGKFCAGAIDHISIRSLQCILLKVCLLLGVTIHSGVEFLEILEPDETRGWHAKVSPDDHKAADFDFDVLVGADGRRSTIPGFDRKELRGKLALAITANFVNYYSREEAAVDEISGVAFIFNQKFFKDLKADTDIDLENIVYYKDDTHYFVMTAKKSSLRKKGVLINDYSDARQLLNPSNIDKEKLYDYASEAADWSTELPQLNFAVNHYGRPDVALFDFTSIYQAEYAARAIHRKGKDLLLCVVGDALLEPFWPTGTGCPRGFLSAMDTAWLIRGLGQKRRILDLLRERESIFQLLPQTIPEKLHANIKAYTIDPQTRYPNLNIRRAQPRISQQLYDTDVNIPSQALMKGSVRVKRVAPDSAVEDDEVFKENIPEVKKPREEELIPEVVSPSRKPLMELGSVQLAYYSEPEAEMSLKDPTVLQNWLQEQVKHHGIKVTDLSTAWSDGRALCALIYHFHPELIPNFDELSPSNAVENNQLAFSIAEEHFGITSLLKPTEMEKPDKLGLFTYLSLFYEFLFNKEPAVITGKPDKAKKSTPMKSTIQRRKSRMKFLATSPPSAERSWNTKSIRRDFSSPPCSPTEPMSPTFVPTKKPHSQSKEEHFRARKPAPAKTPTSRTKTPARPKSQFNPMLSSSSDICYFCNKKVYLMERMSANGLFFHRSCFRCSHCNCQLKIGGYSLSKGIGGEKGKFFCSAHYRQLFLSNPEAINYSRAGAPKRDSQQEEMEVEEKPKEVRVKPDSAQTEPTGVRTQITILEEEEEEENEEDREVIGILRGQPPAPDDVERIEITVPTGPSPVPIIVESPPLMNGEVKEEEGRLEETEKMEVEEKEPAKLLVRPSPSRPPIGGGNVKRLSQGFEQLEAAAKWEQFTPVGRDHVSSGAIAPAKPPRSWSQLEPSEGRGQLAVIEEKKEEEGGRVSPGSPRRPRSPAQWKGPIVKRLPEEEVTYLPRSSANLKRSQWKRRGPKSVTRPLIGTYDTSDVAIQERRKQQQRFRDAQLIQREMSQLERQYEELEDVGRHIEQCLRDADNTSQEDQFMKAWLGLVNERNGLVRKTAELSLKMKELELEDRQYEVDKQLNELSAIPEVEQTAKEMVQFEELCEMKIKIVEERNDIVMQAEEERIRELEEDEGRSVMLDERFGSRKSSCDSTGEESSPHTRRASEPEAQVEAILKKKDKRRSRVKSWLFGN